MEDITGRKNFAAAFAHWIKRAPPGSQCRYYTGLIHLDPDPRIERLRRIARRAVSSGFVDIERVRFRKNGFAHIATRR